MANTAPTYTAKVVMSTLTGNTISLENLPEVRRGGHAREYSQNEQDYLEHRLFK